MEAELREWLEYKIRGITSGLDDSGVDDAAWRRMDGQIDAYKEVLSQMDYLAKQRAERHDGEEDLVPLHG